MSILFWNVRGINKYPRVNDFLTIKGIHRPSIVCLVETKVKEENSSRLLNYFPSDWNSINNYTCDPHGRIWIFLDTKSWNCSMEQSSAQHITLSAINKGGLCCTATFIYAFNLSSQRKRLWNDLLTFS